MKGRIIGREGRNIRTFEKATGVDVIVDDTPGVVIVSAFDNIRRETARLALTKLIQDGRIHPSRIEEVVKETQEEMEKHILEVGKTGGAWTRTSARCTRSWCSCWAGCKFRTSYSQNVLQHSLEVAHLCGMMADELGLDGQLARRCGLLHDIGKAADHEMEGGHPKIGAELAKRYGETSKEVLHAIAGHHDDVTVDHIYTVLVAAADAISAARPGARRETLEKYVKRLEELEAVASGFPGVEHAYAIQAGREVRVIANAAQTQRQRGGQGVPRHRPGDRGAAELSGRDQGHRGARDAGGGVRPVDSSVAAASCAAATASCALSATAKLDHDMRILFIGDIVGQPGVAFVKQALPALIAHEGIDLVIANAENAVGRLRADAELYRKLREAGVDLVTLGDHVYKKQEIIPTLEKDERDLQAGQLSARRSRPRVRHGAGPRRHAGRRLLRCWAGPSCGRSIVPFAPPTAC